MQIDLEDPGKFLEHADEVYIDTLNSSPPQAQQEAAIFVRAPQSLKRSVEQAAQDQGVSVNHLAVRCLEKCLPKAKSYLIIGVTHPAMTTRYGWGAVRAQA